MSLGGAIASFQAISQNVHASVREVNGDVMQLQNATISAKDRIEKSTDALAQLTSRLKGTSVDLEKSRKDYDTLITQLNTARDEYRTLITDIKAQKH
jgi:chromosome segregation ATPase